MKRFCSCVFALVMTACSNYGQLTFVCKLPKKLKENSGIVIRNSKEIWVIEDNGNPDEIYLADLKGNLLSEHKVKDSKNRDWEDLAQDEWGNLYIGDFGNNGNDRKNLGIYKIKGPLDPDKEDFESEYIRFHYPEQKKYPPKKKNRLFDAEAFFYRNEHLYVITKNRTRPFNSEALIYKIPAKKGKYEAELVGKFSACEEAKSCVVTAADISPDGSKIVLLGYGKLWVFSNFQKEDFTQGDFREIDLGATTQLESICFLNDTTLLLSDEQRGPSGRNLYSFKLPEP